MIRQQTLPPSGKAILRFLFRAVVVMVIFLVVVITVYLLPVISDPTEGYLELKGQLVRTERELVRHDHQARTYDVSLFSDSGLQVELSVRVPLNLDSAKPLVLLVGGFTTGRRAIDLLSATNDIVVAALSYPYAGTSDMKGVSLLTNIPHVQRSIHHTGPALLLALDYLEKQDYVDKQHIELLGVSLGAFFVSAPAVLHPGVKRLWLIHGAADPESIFKYRFKEKSSSESLQGLVAWIVDTVCGCHYIDPQIWLPRFAPRPVILVNARDDSAFPASSVKKLHESLQQPNEIIWMEGLHITPGRKEIISQIETLVFSRISTESRQVN